MVIKTKKKVRHYFGRHKHLKHLLLGVLIVIVAFVVIIVGLTIFHKIRTAHQQSLIQPFYNTASLSINGPMGQIVRSQPMNVSLSNGSAIRILYRTQRTDGSVTFASGMIFIPNNNNSGTPRPVVAWAHGTVGMGDSCAPSRTPNPLSAIPWVDAMLAKGWIVTATDYAGLGTPGTEGYLVGGDEARDVLNSVRAAQYISGAEASTKFAVWGHSQGGNSALFTANEASSYAPELHLVGTVASAPAAELVPLMNETYDTTLDWVIGPEVLTSWPATYSGLNPKDIATNNGYNNYKPIANKCIAAAAIEGLVRNALKQDFFKVNLASSPAWLEAAKTNTAPILSPSQPLLVAESLTDQVVLPNTTALYIQKACQANSDLSSLWLTDVGHIQLSSTISPEVIGWIAARFNNQANSSTCNQPLPVTPATDSP